MTQKMTRAFPVRRITVLFAVAAAFFAGPAASAEEHWSFASPSRPAVPTLHSAADRDWARGAIDCFILRRLNEAGLRPADQAQQRVLIRRLYFDLTGLPPQPAEIEAFVNDPAPQAYERLVDRLLASPRYGERWGRHWLDVVRFAESEGYEYDRHRPHAWRYRDWVIDSLNDDAPYDRFVIQQLAGDELWPDDHAARVAAGFHRLGPVRRNAGNQNVAFSRNEILTDRINTIGSVFLGLTVGCARCHDHMFDPIPQADYYRLQAFLAATFADDVPLSSTDDQAAWKKRFDAANAEIKDLEEQLEGATGQEKEILEAQLEMARLQLPPPLPSIFSVKNVADKRTAIRVLRRGDPASPGEPVVPATLSVLPRRAVKLSTNAANPRTRLARWIASPHHPLTARVMANRVWQYHFGRGIVATSNDFGVNGQPPSHPKLLDFLAHELVRGGWRLKPLHRMIVLSSTYRRSSHSAFAQPGGRVDADNRLLWRFSRRRLSAEEIRDGMLAVSGAMFDKFGGASVMVPVERELVDLLYKPSQWAVTEDRGEHARRSIYLMAKRNLRLPFLEVFDQPDLQTSCARRASSTHAPQALELLNGRFSNLLAEKLATRLRRECGDDHDNIVRRAFVLATGRPPTHRQRQLSLKFLEQQPLREFALAMFNLNAFLYVD